VKDVERFRNDPVAFLTECLGMQVDHWQAELIRSRMAKKRPAKKLPKAPKLKARHTIDGIIRDKLAEERARSWSDPKEGFSGQGFCSGLEWVLLQLEALRSK